MRVFPLQRGDGVGIESVSLLERSMSILSALAVVLTATRSRKGVLKGSDRKEEVKRVILKGDESVLQIECPGLLVDGVHLDCVNAQLTGEYEAAPQGIVKK
jgi:hypothetical protein